MQKGTSTWYLIKQVVKHQGYKGLMTGFWITAWRDIPSYGAYFSTYEWICRTWIEETPQMTVENFVKLNVAGGVAGLVGWIPVYPVDVVKSRMQTQSLTAPKYKSNMHCFRTVIAEEGTRTLWRGLTAACIRYVLLLFGLIVTCCLL